jgi:ElaB/YqjD/DUF883 family membrane-anchored ribosome-binding protein
MIHYEEIQKSIQKLLAESEKWVERSLQQLTQSDSKLKSSVQESLVKVEAAMRSNSGLTNEIVILKCHQLQEIVIAL